MVTKFFAGLLVLSLVGSACSSASDTAEGPETSTTAATQTETTTVETTIVESLTGLENELEGEPPSTTVSTAPDEQAAADVAHWLLQTWFWCLDNFAVCDTNQFKKTSKGEVLSNTENQVQGYRDQNETFIPASLPPESRIVWARKSATNPDVVGVLDCQRNYSTRVDNQGEVVDANRVAQVALFLNRVERTEDGTFKLSSALLIDNYKPESEGGDECSKYDGTEVTDELINDFLV